MRARCGQSAGRWRPSTGRGGLRPPILVHTAGRAAPTCTAADGAAAGAPLIVVEGQADAEWHGQASLRIAMVGTRGVPARYGGFETCVEEVGRPLVEHGHRVVVYCRAEHEDLLEAADTVPVPSFGESFGNAAVEGMLAGRPVIASKVQALAEILTDGHTGLLVEAGSAQALAEAIIAVASDPARSQALAGAARAEALERFSVERYRTRIAEVVASSCRDPRSRRHPARSR